MKNYYSVLAQSRLFSGIAPGELPPLLGCLGTRTLRAAKDTLLLAAGDRPVDVGVVLGGQLQVTRDDAEGNRMLVAAIEPADLFAETLCCAGLEESPVTVTAAADSAVLLIRYERILRPCEKSCASHQKLLENMVGILARKNLYLQNRMELIRMKTIRERVMNFLAPLSPGRGRPFRVGFNREEMANYLCVERSALSHELMKMKRDGLIAYHKYAFTIL